MSPEITTLRPGPRLAHHLLGRDAVDRLAALHAAELRPGRQPELGRRDRVEHTGTAVLEHDVAERGPAMAHRHRRDPVAVTLEHVPRLELDNRELEADPAGDPQRERQQLAQTGRPVDRQRPLAAAQVEGLQQARQPEPVVGVEVGQDRSRSARSGRPS